MPSVKQRIQLEQKLWDYTRGLCIDMAITFAKPGVRGENFTWSESFPKSMVGFVEAYWNLSCKPAQRNLPAKHRERIQEIAAAVGKDFAMITGLP